MRKLKNLELRFDEHLHAKCFYNQESMVITSLNLLESSERKNREMGVLLSLTEDTEVFNEALSEAEFIVTRAKKDSTIRSFVSGIVKEAPTKESSWTRTKSKAKATSGIKQEGHCIRCGEDIPYNPEKPYCAKCFNVWKKYEDPDYKEKYCHQYGKKISTTFNSPRCGNCYWETRKQN